MPVGRADSTSRILNLESFYFPVTLTLIIIHSWTLNIKEAYFILGKQLNNILIYVVNNCVNELAAQFQLKI